MAKIQGNYLRCIGADWSCQAAGGRGYYFLYKMGFCDSYLTEIETVRGNVGAIGPADGSQFAVDFHPAEFFGLLEFRENPFSQKFSQIYDAFLQVIKYEFYGIFLYDSRLYYFSGDYFLHINGSIVLSFPSF